SFAVAEDDDGEKSFFAPKTRDGKKDLRVLSRIRHSKNILTIEITVGSPPSRSRRGQPLGYGRRFAAAGDARRETLDDFFRRARPTFQTRSSQHPGWRSCSHPFNSRGWRQCGLRGGFFAATTTVKASSRAALSFRRPRQRRSK